MTTRAAAPAITEETIRSISEAASEPAWLRKRRLDAWRAFEAMAMPNPLEEEWRRTDISGLDLDAVLAPAKLRDSSRRSRLPRELTAAADFDGVVIQSDGEIVSNVRCADLSDKV